MQYFLSNLILSTVTRRLELSMDISAVLAQYPEMWKCFDTSSSGICGNRIHKAMKVWQNFEVQVHCQDKLLWASWWRYISWSPFCLEKNQQEQINEIWESKRSLYLAADGQCDSPGHNTVTMLDTKTNTILDFSIVHVKVCPHIVFLVRQYLKFSMTYIFCPFFNVKLSVWFELSLQNLQWKLYVIYQD